MRLKISQSDFKGRLIFPADSDYDKARTVFYGGIDKRPAVIIRVSDAHDIATAIKFAKSTGLELAVRSGGHSFAGHSVTNGGIVIDLSGMRKLDVDPSAKTVWAQSGLTAREVINEVDKHNLVIGFGDTGSVGIGGITLAGGIGFLVRKYGLTIDNLLSAEIVTADGQIIQADTHNNKDLFWAVRGGGGNFGIAARFKYKLHELNEVYGGLLMLPATPGIIADIVDYASKAPDELSMILNVMPAPPMPFLPAQHYGKLTAMALIMYAGDPKTGEKVIAPIKNLAKPMVDMVKSMRYKDIFFPDNESYHPTAAARNMFMNSVDRSLAGKIINYLNNSDAPMRVVQLRVLGGAMSRVAQNETAFAHRSSKIMCNIAAFYKSEKEKKTRRVWVEELSRELYQGDAGAYVGFLGIGDNDRLNNAYPALVMKRLAEIKKKYDPDNLFSLNFNILPSAS